MNRISSRLGAMALSIVVAVPALTGRVSAEEAAVPVATQPQSVIDPVSTPTTARGSNFQLRSLDNENFCLQVEAGTLSGRTITMQQCNPLTNEQRWAFTWNDDGTNSIVDIQGMCLDGRARLSTDVPIAVRNCRFSDAWQYVVSPAGSISDVKTGRCLQVGATTANTPLVLVECVENRTTQLWKLTR